MADNNVDRRTAWFLISRRSVIFLAAALMMVLVGYMSACSRAPSTTPPLLIATTQPHITATIPLVSATSSPLPTRTRKPTPTTTSTPTAAFLPLPASAILSTPLFTPAFPFRTPTSYPDEPTPIATPPAASYQLKMRGEADLLALIRQLNQTAYDVDYHFAGDFRGDFLYYQQVVRLAVKEFLLRYPDSVDREQAEWLLAFTNTLNRRDSDEWLVAEITQRINRGWLNPADLRSGLEPLGFTAYPLRINIPWSEYHREPLLEPVMNLFGDNLPAYLWAVQNIEESYYTYSMFIAVEQLPDRSFRAVRIHSMHNFPFGGGPELDDVRDLTGDGQPEVVVVDLGCEFGCNTLEAYIYQWQDDRFVELSHGNFGTEDEAGDGFTWEYENQNKNDSTVINVTNIALFEPKLNRRMIWNGEWFQIAERRMEAPVDELLTRDIYQSWIGYAMEFAEFNVTQPVFAHLQIDPPKEQGAAFQDFIRFQMAMVEALSSRVEPARDLLQQIVDSPEDPARPMLPAAAKAFLLRYQGDADIYRSCQAALSVVDRSLRSMRNANPKLSTEVISDNWGFLPASSLCNPRAAFRLQLRSLSLKPGDDITSRLRQAGVPVLYSLNADFDGDKRIDWLVVFDTPASEQLVEAWILVDTGQHYSAVPVYDYLPSFPGYTIGVSNYPIRVESFPFPGNRQPAIVMQAGDQVAIFTVHHKDLTAEVEILQVIDQVKTFQVDPGANELGITYIADAYEPYQDIYGWREGLDQFLQISRVERLIFDEKNPAEAINIIKAEIAALNPKDRIFQWYAPRLYYMLGLAYELQNNPSAAVSTYLKVWREFPGSPYALIAREKIL